MLSSLLAVLLLSWINSYRISRPSSRPSPMMEQQDWMCHKCLPFRSCSPSMLIISFGSFDSGKSCLFANMRRGTWLFWGNFNVLKSSMRASSKRSSSTESMTNIMPSVHLVYGIQSGRSLSWPPISHIVNETFYWREKDLLVSWSRKSSSNMYLCFWKI